MHKHYMMAFLMLMYFITASVTAETLERDTNMLQLIDDAQTVGKARYEYLFWDIYDAELLAPAGDFSPEGPFALKLTYLRDFKGADIAKRSIDEMKKQGLSDKQRQQQWLTLMQALFPDVRKNQSLTGVVDAEGTAHFFYDSEYLGVVEDRDFAQWFFNIWLGDNTSDPKFRQALLAGVSS